MKGIKGLFGVVVFAGVLASCGVNSNVMFKEAKDDVANAAISDSIPLKPFEEYRISEDDKITFSLTTKNGTRIIEDMSGISETSRNSVEVLEYLVQKDGTVKLPIIGNVRIVGLTVSECEDTLELRYTSQYQDPFVQLRVTNQRVIVFPGNGSDAKVIPLLNSNTTLMEALAQAGGITDRGKASAIKLMRKVNGQRVVYRLDLSTMQGLRYVDMVVQANDYIYVEPTPDLSKEIAEDVVPIVSLVSSAILIFSAIIVLK